MLNAWQAEQISLRVEALTKEELKSGSNIVELGSEGKIPVKVSRGEFTDNFLTPGHHLDPDDQPTPKIQLGLSPLTVGGSSHVSTDRFHFLTADNGAYDAVRRLL